MIRIQKLKQPKKTSGEKVGTGRSFKTNGLIIKNTNTFPVYVDSYLRKKPVKKKLAKGRASAVA